MKGSIPLALMGCLVLPVVGAAQDEDEIARQAFRHAFGSAPVASRSVEPGPSAEAEAAVAAGRSAVASPGDPRLQALFADRLGAVVDTQGSGNIMEILMWVVKQSISEMSEDKEYWLSKLARQNHMNEALTDYLGELSEASRELGTREPDGARGPSRTSATVPVTVRIFDPVWVDGLSEPTGERPILCDPCLTTRAATLNAEQVQREQETVLGLQRRLESARLITEARSMELDRQATEVVRMMAEVLKTVAERDDRLERLAPTAPRGSS